VAPSVDSGPPRALGNKMRSPLSPHSVTQVRNVREVVGHKGTLRSLRPLPLR
jgi:hypothetical protein